MESLLEGLPNPVFVKDEQHRWVLLNAALCRFMGRAREELLGRSDFEFFPPEEARVFWEKDDEVFASGGVNENEERFTDAAGRTHVIITRKTLHEDASGRRFLLGVITDITALRETSEQLRASRDELEERVRQRTAELSEANELLRRQDAQRTAFLNMLGHELRNPLSAIRASTLVLDRAPAGTPAALRARAALERQVPHLARLCDDLLDAARVAHGNFELHRTVLALGPAVAAICEDQRSAFEARGIALRFEAPPDGPWVDADETRLFQAVGNLLHNALKFTPPGGAVDVAVRRSGTRAEVVVRDTGVGLAPGELARVFEPFVRAEGARGGLGLGLALARGIAEAHGGGVEARSEGPGRGAEIGIWLPAAPAPRPAAPHLQPAGAGRAVRVVIVEDSADVRDTLVDLLRLEGHEVHAAGDGRSGLALAAAVRPDAVLCDLGLPDLDGYEVARLLRAEPELSGCTLVALSGYAQPEDVARARQAGFDAHLAKPPSVERLREVLAGPGRDDERRAVERRQR